MPHFDDWNKTWWELLRVKGEFQVCFNYQFILTNYMYMSCKALSPLSGYTATLTTVSSTTLQTFFFFFFSVSLKWMDCIKNNFQKIITWSLLKISELSGFLTTSLSKKLKRLHCGWGKKKKIKLLMNNPIHFTCVIDWGQNKQKVWSTAWAPGMKTSGQSLFFFFFRTKFVSSYKYVYFIHQRLKSANIFKSLKLTFWIFFFFFYPGWYLSSFFISHTFHSGVVSIHKWQLSAFRIF